MVILLDLSLTSNSPEGTTHLLQSPRLSLGGQGSLFSVDRPSGSLPVSGQEVVEAQRSVCLTQSHTVRGRAVPEPAALSSCFLKD